MVNWNGMKLRKLNWNDQNLEDWIELWPKIKGEICNLAFNLLTKENVNNTTFVLQILQQLWSDTQWVVDYHI